MTWFKVDDSFHAHPKVLATEPAALGLWVVAGAWSSANLTDGFVPDHVLPRLLPDGLSLAEQLRTSGLWRRKKGGYEFHDWADYNPTKTEVEGERKAARDRMKTLRENRKSAAQSQERSGEQPGNVRAKFGRSSQPPTRPDPTRTSVPSEQRPPETSSPPEPRKHGTRIPDDFTVTPPMRQWFAERCPHVDGPRETEKFRNYWQAKSGKDAEKIDWPATWRNWMLTAAERAGPRPRSALTGANRHTAQRRDNPFAEDRP